MSTKKQLPRGFDLGEPDPDDVKAFIRGAGTLPPTRAIGDEALAERTAQLTTPQHTAPEQTATQQPARYPWHDGNPRVKRNYNITPDEPLMLKLEYLKERGKGSMRATMMAGIEKEADRLLLECGVPPSAL